MKALKVMKNVLEAGTNWKFGEILFTGAMLWIGGYLVGSGKEGLKGCETEEALRIALRDKKLAEINVDGYKRLYELRCKEVEELEKEAANK